MALSEFQFEKPKQYNFKDCAGVARKNCLVKEVVEGEKKRVYRLSLQKKGGHNGKKVG